MKYLFVLTYLKVEFSTVQWLLAMRPLNCSCSCNPAIKHVQLLPFPLCLCVCVPVCVDGGLAYV